MKDLLARERERERGGFNSSSVRSQMGKSSRGEGGMFRSRYREFFLDRRDWAVHVVNDQNSS